MVLVLRWMELFLLIIVGLRVAMFFFLNLNNLLVCMFTVLSQDLLDSIVP